MQKLVQELSYLFNNALKSIFGYDPPVVDSKGIDTELIKYVYPGQLLTHSRDDSEKRVHELIKEPFWTWDKFKEILIHLVYIGERKYIPSINIPKAIYIDGIKSIVIELINISAQHSGVEVSRTIFVDRERFCLIQSGRTKIGSSNSVIGDLSPEYDREYLQTPIAIIHIHPLLSGSYLFSYMDYISFLSDPRLIMMIVSNKQEIVITLKTSSTRDNADIEGIKRQIIMTKEDIERIWRKLGLINYELVLNKTICTEFGLILYKSLKGKKNIVRHINVIDT